MLPSQVGVLNWNCADHAGAAHGCPDIFQYFFCLRRPTSSSRRRRSSTSRGLRSMPEGTRPTPHGPSPMRRRTRSPRHGPRSMPERTLSVWHGPRSTRHGTGSTPRGRPSMPHGRPSFPGRNNWYQTEYQCFASKTPEQAVFGQPSPRRRQNPSRGVCVRLRTRAIGPSPPIRGATSLANGAIGRTISVK